MSSPYGLRDKTRNPYGIGEQDVVQKKKKKGKKKMAKTCNHGSAQAIMKIGAATIWAGDETAFRNFGLPLALVIDLAGKIKTMSEADRKLIPSFLRRFLRAMKQTVLHISWPDFGTPSITKAQWVALAHDIAAHGGNVLVQCGHGHGRTGTALACLAVAYSPTMKEHAIDFVRRVYCPDAIETHGQCDYITNMFSLRQRDGSQKPVATAPYAQSFSSQPIGTTKPTDYTNQSGFKHGDKQTWVAPHLAGPDGETRLGVFWGAGTSVPGYWKTVEPASPTPRCDLCNRTLIEGEVSYCGFCIEKMPKT